MKTNFFKESKAYLSRKSKLNGETQLTDTYGS